MYVPSFRRILFLSGGDRSLGVGAEVLDVQDVTEDGTYTPTEGTSYVLVIATGGGGGGAGVNNSSADDTAGQGGKSGATAFWMGPLIEVEGATVTIGTGGAGGVGANDGAAGGDTTVVLSGGINLTADGGPGGNFQSQGVVVSFNAKDEADGATGDDFHIRPGLNFGANFFNGTAGDSPRGGSGGSSFFGGDAGGFATISSAGNGATATRRGAGGGGAADDGGTSSVNGGAGADGGVYFIEFK